MLRNAKYAFSMIVNVEKFARRSGLMAGTLDSGSSGQGSSAYRGHCDEFLGKTQHFFSTDVYTGEFNAGGNPAGGWEIYLLVAGDKRRPVVMGHWARTQSLPHLFT